MKISLGIIVGDDPVRLNNLLDSVKYVFDEIIVTLTTDSKEVEEVVAKHKGVLSRFEWVNDFAAARQYNLEQCTGDWYVWFDSDDVVKNADNIRRNIELAEQNGVTGLHTLYHYSHDENGNVEDSHWKLQMVKRGCYKWDGVIHENLTPIAEVKESRVNNVIRVHTATKEDSSRSLERNSIILQNEISKQPNEPRNYFYLARCYLGIENWQGVIDVVDTYLKLSNWPEERYEAINMKGEAYTRLGDYDKAIETHHEAILELEDAPDAYIYKARNYIQKERWHDALTNLEIAEQRDQDATVLKRSNLYDHDLYNLYAIASLNIGMFDAGVAAAERAYQNRPTETAKEMLAIAKQMQSDEAIVKDIYTKGKELLEKPQELQELLKTVPEHLKDEPRILSLSFSSPKNWSDNSVVFYCGNSLEDWDGESTNNGGIGGSETAVIELAKRFVAAGKEVTVFNRCDADADGKVIDGVHYENFWKFNPDDSYNTIILWRWPQYVDHVHNAKNIVVDMHDVSSDNYFTPERLEKIDTIMVKTNYHRSLYPSVPDEKFVIVGNGIDMDRFVKKPKKAHKFIYTSSANRGLENILDIWPQIREKVPNAELHIFYGWKSFYETHKKEPAMLEWMENMKRKMSQDGIINHDRVGQRELAEQMADASLWLYPTEFPEIHCITALEMQASRCYPITTGFAALAETQQSGIKIAGDPKTKEWRDKFLKEIVFAYENKPILKTEIKKGYEYAQACSWDNVANVWLTKI